MQTIVPANDSRIPQRPALHLADVGLLLGAMQAYASPAGLSPVLDRRDALYSHVAGLLIEPGRMLTHPSTSSQLAPPKAKQASLLKRCWRAVRRAPYTRRAPPLHAADSLGEILRSGLIDARTTLVFDVDRTLLRMRDNVLPRDKSMWPALTEPVEPQTAAVVRRLQQSGVPMFGLTARGLGTTWEIADVTEAQLHQIGVDLRTTTPVDDVADYGLMWRTASRAGITYCGHQTKGEVLAAIYQRYELGRVVVIDDGMHNFASLLEAAHAHRRALTCIYYRHDLQAEERAGEAWDWFWYQSTGVPPCHT